MATSGRLTDFSFPELAQFLDQGMKTGLLRLYQTGSQREIGHIYIWLREGRIVGIANGLNHESLMIAMQQQKLLDPDLEVPLEKLNKSLTPLGVYLLSNKLVDGKQLKTFYHGQVYRLVNIILQCQDTLFKFDEGITCPASMMTGLSIRASQGVLMTMRRLPNWEALISRLPKPSSALTPIQSQRPHVLTLHPLEKETLALATAKGSLSDVAQKLQRPTLDIQKVAFWLIISGMVEEVPMVATASDLPMTATTMAVNLAHAALEREQGNNAPAQPKQESVLNAKVAVLESTRSKQESVLNAKVAVLEPTQPKQDISQSFLNNLVGFLKNRGVPVCSPQSS